MPFFVWLRNVSRRTLKAFVPNLAKPDDAFAKARLRAAEWPLYAAMDSRDRDHACEVAKAVMAAGGAEQLVRAALLHDVGKTGNFKPLERILVHLYLAAGLSGDVAPGLSYAARRNLEHAAYGAELIRRAGGCERVAELVARHHAPGEDAEAKLLERIERQF